MFLYGDRIQSKPPPLFFIFLFLFSPSHPPAPDPCGPPLTENSISLGQGESSLEALNFGRPPFGRTTTSISVQTPCCICMSARMGGYAPYCCIRHVYYSYPLRNAGTACWMAGVVTRPLGELSPTHAICRKPALERLASTSLTLRPLHEGAATARWRSSKTRQKRIPV